ncbi:hypothetical protein [Streptomyces sp. NPDC057325]|uniref:hypothetical protein n=1 Tax=unclassified Streptomyces TaxID=2593676 RepID=UPI00363663F0
MSVFRQYFESNPEIFAALVAAFAIVGSYFAGVRGAKIQARGGQDQAAAAREAAQIAAEAQRIAALWAVQQAQSAEFIRSVRELGRIADQLTHHPHDESLHEYGEAVVREVVLRYAEIELTAHRRVVQVAKISEGMVLRRFRRQQVRAKIYRAREALEQLSSSTDGNSVARDALDVFLARRGTDDERRQIFLSVPELTGDQVDYLVRGSSNADATADEWTQHEREGLQMALKMFVTGTRRMLRSEDGITPVVPEQRRWWRRNPAAASTDSA